MLDVNRLNKDNILSDDVFEEIFAHENDITRTKLLIDLEKRAAELGELRHCKQIIRAYKTALKNLNKKKSSGGNITAFSGDYKPLRCAGWIADDRGIYQVNNLSGQTDIVACYHPILPVERLKNIETGEEMLKIAFKRNSHWEEIIIPKVVVSSASKITGLSSRGISVTSENAKQLVRYLSDVENMNEDNIKVQFSTGKLGWTKKGDFIPYDTSITFDADARFLALKDSIEASGRRSVWYEHVLKIRESENFEPKFLLAASFASILVKILNALPFFVDLWGQTEGGKSVALMLAASVWANPAEGAYIGDYKSTDVGLEQKADMLNNLPLILDDTSQKDKKTEEHFESLVYTLCSGKGKTRSNKELGLNRESSWKNCILTNGERPLTSYVSQGGAINRILEVEASNKLFEDPRATADLIRNNYGFAGKDFVEVIKTMKIEDIREIQERFLEELQDDEKMQKQSLSLSVVLTADKIATDYLFKDNKYLDLNTAKRVLEEREVVSDNERAYQFILDKIAMNPARFASENENIEKWGLLEKEYAIFYNSAFNQLCTLGGFSRKSFLSWADKKSLLQTDKGRKDKNKRLGKTVVKCIFLKILDTKIDSEFKIVDEREQTGIPFI